MVIRDGLTQKTYKANDKSDSVAMAVEWKSDYLLGLRELEQRDKANEGFYAAYTLLAAKYSSLATVPTMTNDGSTNTDLAALYKNHNDTVQQLEDQTQELHRVQSLARSLKNQLDQAKANARALEMRAATLNETMGEKNKAIETLQDEALALQMEVHVVGDANVDLKSENAKLVERWLRRMEDDADKMNVANEFFEEYKKKAEKRDN